MSSRQKLKFIFSAILVIPIFGCTRGCSQGQFQTSEAQKVLNIDQGFDFPPGFPADPGPRGKLTIEGIDSDQDGVRDDVQRWIFARFPKDEAKRKALRQLAKANQEQLRPDLVARDYEAIWTQLSKASDCIWEHFPFDSDSVDDEYLRARVLNTKQRTERYLDFDKYFDGKMIHREIFEGNACEK
jgi:hypothetical protein